MDTATRRELKALLRRGEDALVRRDYERASTYFRRAYTVDPGNIAAITNLGYSYARMGRFSHAQKCFITALDIDPDSPVARKNLSLLMKPEKGERSPSPVSGKGKSEEELFVRYMQWGNLQMEQKNLYAAIQYFREASRIHPDFIEPYLKMGTSFEELKEYAAAAGAFSNALDIFPKDPVALQHLERCRGLADEREEREGLARSRRDDTASSVEEAVPLRSPASYPVVNPLSEKNPLSERIVETHTSPPYRDPAAEGPRQSAPQEQSGSDSISTSPSGPDKASAPARLADDDLIKSILNQYSDIINSGKAKEEESGSDLVSESEKVLPPVNPVVSSPTPASPGSSDDIVSSILMQYQEELEPANESSPQERDSQTDTPHTGDAPLSGEGTTMTIEKKDGIHVELNENQKDALRELGNIGASHAATTLSTMLNTPIMLNVPEIDITNLENISRQIPEENSAMVIFTMEGQMAKAGYVILHVPRDSVVQMTSIMLGMPVEPGRELNEMDESAINEIGNIMVSAFLDGTAELLGIIMLPSPPRTLFDYPKKIFDLIIQESNILYDNVVFFKTELICDEHELNLNIFMLPNPPVLHEIVRMLEKIIEDSATGR